MDVPSRWNSTYLMLECLCQLHVFVGQIIGSPFLASISAAIHLELKDYHWLFIPNLVTALKPIKLITSLLLLHQVSLLIFLYCL